MVISYGHDVKVINEIYEAPCDFVTNNMDACLTMEELNEPNFIIGEGLILEINSFPIADK